MNIPLFSSAHHYYANKQSFFLQRTASYWPQAAFNMLVWSSGRHVKERTISMKLVVDFGPILGNAYTLAAALSALV